MTLTVDQLTAFDSGAFTTAAKNLDTASDGVTTASGQVQSASQTMEFWEGTAADAALNKLGNAGSAVYDAPPVLNGASEVLSAFVASVLRHQADLKTAVAQVNALDFPNGAKATIASDGTVTAPPNPVTSCSSDPTTEKANEKTETSYENAAAKLPALQSTIQAALQGATAADTRASGDLQKAIRGASDFNITLVDGVSAPGAEDLYNIGTQLTGDGKTWLNEQARAAATLVKQAATDPSAAAKLQREYGTAVRTDPAFATALLNNLSPAQIEQLVTKEGYSDLRNNADSYATEPKDDPFTQFLSMAIASGTAGTGNYQAVDDGTAVDGSWLQNLITASGKNEAPGGDNSVPGYWALGQILSAASQKGQVPYSTTFLTTIGPAMTQWDKDSNDQGHHWQKDPGPNKDGDFYQYLSDPLVGLMTAAATNGTGAAALFNTHMGGISTPSGAPSDILTYLVSDHHWDPIQNPSLSDDITAGGNVSNDIGDGGDNGSALGAALVAATGTSIKGHDALAAQALSTYGEAVQADSSRGDGLSGLREPMAKVLSANYGVVTQTVSTGQGGGGAHGDVGDLRALGYVVDQISRDPKAYTGLSAAAMASLQSQSAGSSSWQNSAQSLGFITQAHNISMVNQGATADADATARASEINGTIGSVIDAVPLPDSAGVAGDLGKDAVSYIWDKVAPMPDPNAHGTNARDAAADNWDSLHSYIDSTYGNNPTDRTTGLTYINDGSNLATQNLAALYQGQQPPAGG